LPSGSQGSKAARPRQRISTDVTGHDFADSTTELPFRVSGRRCVASPRRRRGPAAASLFPLPVRLELPKDAYAAVPACWWSRERWIAHNLALYDEHYEQLRTEEKVDSVGRRTFEHYLIAESGGADYKTGRNSRVTIGQLQTVTRRSESTMHRCRRLTKAFTTRTVVFGGRHRTLIERLDSWRRGDRGRGWAAVSALHESTTLPVDNEAVETLLDQGFGTPPGRSPGSAFISRRKSVSSLENAMNGRAPRGTDKRRRAKAVPAYDQRAVKLTSGVLRDERFPLWVRQIARGRLTALLTRKAVAGWDVDDVFGAIEEFRISGKRLISAPSNPPGYLWSVLDQIPDDMPPARLDRARTVALEETERLARQRQRQAERTAAMAAASEDSPARRAAMQLSREIGAGTTGRAADRAREADQAHRELAQRARVTGVEVQPSEIRRLARYRR
jgi:hypothetical protein